MQTTVSDLTRSVNLAFGVVLVLAGLALFLLCHPSGARAGNVTVLMSVTDFGITLTLADAEAALGSLDPGEEGSDEVSGTVRSNRRWRLTYVATNLGSGTDSIAIGEVSLEGTDIPNPIRLSASGTIYDDMPRYPNPRNPYRFTHTYRLTLPWTVNPGVYSGCIIYSATQI